MAIDATPGSVTGNSYATIAEANAYFDNHPERDAWDSVLEPEQALIWATRLIDGFDFIGDQATDTQALEWPRISNDVFELTWDETEIPPRLKMAEFELALSGFRQDATTTGSDVSTGAISSLKIGSALALTFDTSSGVVITADLAGLNMEAARMLRGLRLVAVLA